MKKAFIRAKRPSPDADPVDDSLRLRLVGAVVSASSRTVFLFVLANAVRLVGTPCHAKCRLARHPVQNYRGALGERAKGAVYYEQVDGEEWQGQALGQ